jgi:hypothetical protein
MWRVASGLACLAGLAAGALAACRSTSEPATPEELGIIEFYGDRTGVLALPDTVRAGHDVEVTVRTFGGGCVSAAGTGLRYHGALAVILPYDNPSSRAPAGTGCPDILLRISHTVTLRFPTPGQALVRAEGRREPGGGTTAVEGTLVVTAP